MNVYEAFWHLFQLSAPWLLFGLLIAGLLNIYMPASFLTKHLGGSNVLTVFKAAFIGAPLPLCSCGVIPAAIGLRRAGASKAATSSFLVATPETGVDSVSMSYALLGPVMAIVRPIAALFSAIVTGLLTLFVENDESQPQASEVKSCCAKSKNQQAEVVKPKWQQALSFAFVDMVRDVAKWLVIGLAVAAVIMAYVPPSWLGDYGHGFGAMLMMILVGIPMYICATASTPIAAGLLVSGISPGAVLVFMLVGPATNIATIGVVKSELGIKVALIYVVGVIGCAIISGLTLDWLLMQFAIEINPQQAMEHEIFPVWMAQIAAGILVLLLGNVFVYEPIKKTRLNSKKHSQSQL